MHKIQTPKSRPKPPADKLTGQLAWVWTPVGEQALIQEWRLSSGKTEWRIVPKMYWSDAFPESAS